MSTVQDTSSVSSLFGAGTTAASTANGSATDIQNRFLSLLVAQMKNQDPLNPLDNAQVTSQMAQLSTVQGITNMNTSLQALSASLGAGQVSQAASLIGRDVLVPGNTVGPAQPQDVMGFDLSRAGRRRHGQHQGCIGQPGAQTGSWPPRCRREHGGLGRADGQRYGRARRCLQLHGQRRPGRPGGRQHRLDAWAWSTAFRRTARGFS